MRRIKNPYEFRETQVFTPENVVDCIWKIVSTFRPQHQSVVDLGAGDGRFALSGQYKTYRGIEIDPTTPQRTLPENASLEYDCAFEATIEKCGIAVGNPPYVRNHYIELPWMDKIARRFKQNLNVEINRQANLFVYFLLLGIDVTDPKGLVAMLTPYEWVTRPSSKPLRTLINENKWGVSVYRFKTRIFDSVMTTAALSIIDKSKSDAKWNFHEIDDQFSIKKRRMASGSKYKVLSYEKRGDSWSLRGLSPGTQEVFTLTEGERIHHGLSLRDVYPCVTTLRKLDRQTTVLDKDVFNRCFRDAGAKCWIIRSHRKKLGKRLESYLRNVPESAYQTTTCTKRTIWYKYKPFPIPDILVSSGFTQFGPKVVKNVMRVRHVGSVYGVFASDQDLDAMIHKLRVFNFEDRVVAHSGRLKKIEIRQLNGVLQKIVHEIEA